MKKIEGGCLCGAVRYVLRGPLRDVVACHCAQCRRWHGHVGAYTAVKKEGLHLAAPDKVAWYRSSDHASRGFCATCGSSLFWRANDRDTVSIAAGSLDDPSGLKLAAHIFVPDRPAYDLILDGLPTHQKGLQSPRIDPAATAASS